MEIKFQKKVLEGKSFLEVFIWPIFSEGKNKRLFVKKFPAGEFRAEVLTPFKEISFTGPASVQFPFFALESFLSEENPIPVSPSNRIHLFGNVYFEKKDAVFSPLDKKVLEYLVSLSKKEGHEKDGTPRKIQFFVRELAEKLSKEDSWTVERYTVEVIKSVARLSLILLFFWGRFFVFVEDSEEGKREKSPSVSASLVILQGYKIKEEGPKVLISTRFGRDFYNFAIRENCNSKHN